MSAPARILPARILMVTMAFWHGGVQRVTAHLSCEWARQHKVTIAVFGASDEVYAVGGTMHNLRIPDSGSIPRRVVLGLVGTGRLVRLIWQTRPTHLIGFGEYANLVLILAAAVTGTLGRTIVSVHASPRLGLSGLMRGLIRVVYRLPKRIVVVSAGIKRELVAMGLADAKIKFIPNPAPEVV